MAERNWKFQIMSGVLFGIGIFASFAMLGLAMFLTFRGTHFINDLKDQLVTNSFNNQKMTADQLIAVQKLIRSKIVLTSDQTLQVVVGYFSDLIVIVLTMLGLTTIAGYITINRKIKTEAEKALDESVVHHLKTNSEIHKIIINQLSAQVEDQFQEKLDEIDEKWENKIYGNLSKETVSINNVRVRNGSRSKKTNKRRN